MEFSNGYEIADALASISKTAERIADNLENIQYAIWELSKQFEDNPHEMLDLAHKYETIAADDLFNDEVKKHLTKTVELLKQCDEEEFKKRHPEDFKDD